MEIEDYPNYLIYPDGKVYTKKFNRFLKQSLRGGYYRVQLFNNRKGKDFSVHRLVAIHYIPNPNNLPIVDHKDCNKFNNHISNLRWCNYSQNNQNSKCHKINKLSIKNIYKQENAFYFEKTYKGKRYRERFKTLEEAVEYKTELYKKWNDDFIK